MKRAPLPQGDAERLLLRAGDLLFARQSLKLEGAGRCVLVKEIPEPTTWEGHILRARLDPSLAEAAFYYYWFRSPKGQHAVRGIVEQVAAAGIRGSDLSRLTVPKPAMKEQAGIAATLGALDDKIESNGRVVKSSRSLGHAILNRALEKGDRIEGLGALAVSIARGAAPRYADNNSSAPLVLNQKCIRDGLVSTAPARRTEPRPLAVAKKARRGDVLVNSTGTGTLGRVGRWPGGEVFVDSHVTVVRPDAAACPPTVLAYALLSAQPWIEALATGSTGQTELSRDRLAALPITLPAGDLTSLEAELLALEDRLEAARRESEALARLRDALLPELMSGRIRVPEAREAVEDAVGNVAG